MLIWGNLGACWWSLDGHWKPPTPSLSTTSAKFPRPPFPGRPLHYPSPLLSAPTWPGPRIFNYCSPHCLLPAGRRRQAPCWYHCLLHPALPSLSHSVMVMVTAAWWIGRSRQAEGGGSGHSASHEVEGPPQGGTGASRSKKSQMSRGVRVWVHPAAVPSLCSHVSSGHISWTAPCPGFLWMALSEMEGGIVWMRAKSPHTSARGNHWYLTDPFLPTLPHPSEVFLSCTISFSLRENCSTKQVTRRDEWRQLLSTTAWPSTWNCRRLIGCFLGRSSENENSLGSWKEEGAVKLPPPVGPFVFTLGGLTTPGL